MNERPGPPLVFISYRIADTKQVADRLTGELKRRLEYGQVFHDRNSIDGGESWPAKIQSGLKSARAVLVLVGSKWLTEQDEYGERRLSKKDDWVRLEVRTALGRTDDPLILQVLVDDQKPIPAAALRSVPDIVEFASIQGTRLRTEDWKRDVEDILLLLERAGFRLRSTARTKDEPPSFAPASRGIFVGREFNLTALKRLVQEEREREGGQRPIGLVGTGGVGKTSLAFELIRQIGQDFDHVILMRRPPEGHPKAAISVFREWAGDMGRPVDKEYTAAEIRSYLAEHYESLLVLIDDAWHGDIEELRLINRALPADATRLLTTREKHVCTELEARPYEVGPMPDNEAIQLIRELLVARFGLVAAGGEAGIDTAMAHHRAALEGFIERVEGHPLAIRLGIGSCESLAEIDDVVRRLVASLARGVGRFKTAENAVAEPKQNPDARNRSLAASLRVSLEDMEADDAKQGTDTARRFKALGVFPEGCTLDAGFIFSVWGDEPPDDAAGLDARKSLVDRCLLNVNVDSGEYSVQSVLRAFALGLLQEDAATFLETRRRYHRMVVQRATESHTTGPDQWSATDYLYPHLAHVLPELVSSLEQVAERGLDVLAASGAPPADALERLRRNASDDVEIGRGLSEGFRHAASLRPEWGDTGLRLLKLGLLCARVAGDPNEEAGFLGRLGDRYTTRNAALSEGYFASALETARRHDTAALGDILTFYAESRRARSEWDGALRLAREALDIHHDAGHELREAKTRSIMGEVLWRMSQLDAADEQYRVALRIYRTHESDKGEADVLNLLASNEFNRGGRYEQAIELFEQALEKHEKLRDLAMKAQDLNDMGAAHRYLARYEKAEGLFKEALALNRLIGNRRLEAINICNIAGALWAQEQYDLAQRRAAEGQRIGVEIDDKVPQLWGLVWGGLALQGMRQLDDAERTLRAAVELGRTMDNPRGLAGALGRLGVLLCDDLDKVAEGLGAVREAVGLLHEHDLAAAFSNITRDELRQRLDVVDRQ